MGKKRRKYEKKVVVPKGVTFEDLVRLSVGKPIEKRQSDDPDLNIQASPPKHKK